MASFVEDLWSSVFTPGANPTLIIATNATFAVLQLVFFVFLIATYSIHFVILSVLCGGLWYSINWFVAEVGAIKEQEEREKRAADQRQKKDSSPLSPGAIDSTESETETESLAGGVTGGAKLPTKTASALAGAAARRSPAPARGSTPSASGMQSTAKSEAQEVRQRNAPGDSSGYVSTDSEWEKIEEDR